MTLLEIKKFFNICFVIEIKIFVGALEPTSKINKKACLGNSCV